MNRSSVSPAVRLSNFADRYIALLILGSCGYIGFRILTSEILPLAQLIVPTLIFVLIHCVAIALLLSGIFRTGNEFEIHLKVIAITAAIVGGSVFGSKTLDQAIREKAAIDEKIDVMLCQAKVTTAIPNPKESEVWCSTERNRASLR